MTAQTKIRRTMVAIAAMVLCALIATLTSVTTSDAQVQSLADQAPDGFNVGGVLHAYDGQWDQGVYANVAAEQFNAITATAYMPWGPTPAGLTPQTPAAQVPIDSGPLDRMVDWAQERDMLVHGHVLLYPLANQSLGWYQDERFDGERTELAKRYIEIMAGSNPGGIDVWDVVNEVIADPYQLENQINVDAWGLRTDFVEYDEIGDDEQDYVEKAFEWADAVVDDDVKLIINDYGAETENAKSDALFAYVVELKRRGVPIDGVGFQMHVASTGSDPDYASMERNFRRFANEGFELYITELDVQATTFDNGQASPTDAQLRRQAQVYAAITELALRVPQLNTLLMWDFADGRSWLNPTDRVLGDLPIGSWTHPALWSGGEGNQAMIPKPAYFAMSDALASTERAVVQPAGDNVAATGVRITNAWDSSSAYLTRHGVAVGGDRYDPTFEAGLYVLDGQSESWSSMRWSLEPTGDGYVRIRNDWADESGYLGRSGTWNGSEWVPEQQIFLDTLDADGWHQQWRLEPAGDGGYSFINRWAPETGVLTRDGSSADGIFYEPTTSASLYPAEEWSSQHWLLQD